MLRALVVDDEKPARDDLVWMLERQPDVGEIVEAEGAAAALRLLASEPPESNFDVLFLDIRMPDMDGFDIARTIARFEDPPPVVFVTAFDTPASDAFELGIVDYLRKPVAADRLNRAVQRVLAVRAPTVPDNDLAPDRLFVSTASGRQVLLRPTDVLHFEASGDYVRVHTPDASYLVRDTMVRLTDGWSKHGFVRIHRGFSVRLAAVDEVRSGASGRSVVVGEIEIPVSRRYARELTLRLSGVSGPDGT